MYRKPSGKKAAVKLIATYTLMTLGVLSVVALFILLIFNYRFDRDTGEFEQQGLIQFDSIPSDASVRVNDRLLSSKTATKRSVLPGVHEFMLEKAGYQTWYKKVDVAAGSLVWLDYARLVPTEKSIFTVADYSNVDSSLAAPNRKTILVHESAGSAEFELVSIENETIESTAVTLPASVFSSAPRGTSHTFTPVRWDSGGRYVLLQHEYGDSKEWIVFDTESPNKSQNLTAEFNISISSAYFSGTSGNILYLMTDSSVRKVDLDNQTISRTLVSDVASFRLYDTSSFTYVSRVDEKTNTREVGLYRDGDTEPYILRTVDSPDVSVFAAINEYYGHTYLALAEANNVSIYRGEYDNSSDAATLIAEHDFEYSVDALEFNSMGNYVSIRAGDELGAYSVEQNAMTTGTVDGGSSKDLKWLDNMNVWSVVNGQLTMREIDGANVQTIVPALADQAVTLSGNDGKYLYYFTEEDGDVLLQRVQMIL